MFALYFDVNLLLLTFVLFYIQAQGSCILKRLNAKMMYFISLCVINVLWRAMEVGIVSAAYTTEKTTSPGIDKLHADVCVRFFCSCTLDYGWMNLILQFFEVRKKLFNLSIRDHVTK